MGSQEQTQPMVFVMKVWIFKGEKFERDTNSADNDNKIINEELKKVEK